MPRPGLLAPVVVLGDSHAYPLYFGFHGAYARPSKQRLVMLGAPGCPPFRNIESFEKGSRDTCRELMTTLLDRFLADTAVRTVVLVARWPLYVSGIGVGPVDVHNRIIRNASSKPNAQPYARVIEDALSETVGRLLAAGKNVIVMGTPPELGFEPTACLDNRPVSFSTRNLQRCGIEHSSYVERTREYREILGRITAANPKVLSIDPAKLLCDATFCYAYRDRKFLYSDNNHLSVTGAKLVVNSVSLPQ